MTKLEMIAGESQTLVATRPVDDRHSRAPLRAGTLVYVSEENLAGWNMLVLVTLRGEPTNAGEFVGFEDVADAQAWCERVGLKGVEEFKSSVRFLDLDPRREGTS